MNLEEFFVLVEKLAEGKPYRPHRLIMFLSVLELFDEGHYIDNKIYFNEVLKNRFSYYFNIFSTDKDSNRPHTPFFHLINSGFWLLKSIPGREEVLAKLQTVGGPGAITENVEYAYLTDSAYNLIKDPKNLSIIKQRIESVLRSHAEMLNDPPGLYIAAGLDDSIFKHESTAIMQIVKSTSSFAKTVNNMWLFDQQSNNYYEYDLIMVSHSGIYVIELKHWSGNIQILPHNWLVNNTQYRTDPHKNNGHKCRILKGLYQHQFRTYPDVWVESVVVLTNPNATVEGAAMPTKAADQGLHSPTFASIEDFLRYILRREKAIAPTLNNNHTNAIVQYLHGLNKPQLGIKYTVPGYETLEYLSQRPECIELLARPTGAKARGLNRFRIFRVPYEINAQQKQRLIKMAKNTIEVVSQMGDHPNIQRVWFMENQDGDIIEGSEWSEIGTLRDYLIAQDYTIPVDEAVRIIIGIAHGLKAAHDQGIIHRSVKPENILIFNGVPKLLNFDLAYQIEDEHLTVIEDPSQLKDDGYIAPEMLVGKDIDEGTDLFSLGVIAYELVTGEKPFKTSREFAAHGGRLGAQRLDKLLAAGLDQDTIGVIDGMVMVDRHSRLKDADFIIEVISEGIDLPSDLELPIVNRQLEPGETYDVYEIVSMIGQGAEAQIYLARTARLDEVVLKLFNSEIPKERIFREAEITSLINSAYVVHCDNKYGHWKNDRYFIVLDYINSPSMRWFIEHGERPSIDQFRSVAISLMQGIEAFHRFKDDDGINRVLLHSDIKPENILITSDNKPILIDLGLAGEPRVDWFQGTLHYIPPDNILGIDMQYAEDGDLFALGVSLWEWVFGIRPYIKPTVGTVPTLPENYCVLDDHLRQWLRKAVATTKDERFLTIEDMEKLFFMEPATDLSVGATSNDKAPVIDTTEEERAVDDREIESIEINNFVSYLTTLSNASAANENATAESQIGSTDFERIRVENPVTKYVYGQLFEQNRNVILTGNAGDGKTTIAAEILKQKIGTISHLNSREEIDGLTVIKDMSELPQNDRPLVFKEALETPDRRFLIVSNTGTLIENFLKTGFGSEKISESELLECLEAEQPSLILEDQFMLVNLGRINSIEAAINVFQRIIEPNNWTTCDTCSRRDMCPIKLSIDLLVEHQITVSERVKWLYRRLYEYGHRLTMRQMTGHLAYAITGGLNCSVIHQMGPIQLTEQLEGYMFHNRLFGDNGTDVIPEAIQLLPVQYLQKAELGVFLEPKTERALIEDDTDKIDLSRQLKELIRKVKNAPNNVQMTSRRQIRRLLYFFMPNDNNENVPFLTGFLKSPTLIDFMRYVDGGIIPPLEEDRLRKLILQVLQEQWTGIRLPEGQFKISDLYITVRPPKGYAMTQIILCRIHGEDFQLGINTVNQVGELRNNQMVLRLKDSNIELVLDLPFLDFVARRYQGEIAERISQFYEDRLDLFKAMLLDKKGNIEEDKLALLKVGSSESFQVLTVRVNDDVLEVLQ